MYSTISIPKGFLFSLLLSPCLLVAQESRLESFLKMRDANNDGKISETEAGPVLKRNFERLDKNSDGFIDRKEFAAFGTRGEGSRKPDATASAEPDFADVKYGEHERCVMDIWLAEGSGDSPAPAVIAIHGGGFVGGDKNLVRRSVEQYREKGISFVAINYPFKTQVSWPEVFPAALRSIQFLRHHADQYKIDADRIALFGGSAGAGIALWAAFHDDLADPDSDDPVARQSSKPLCSVALSTQATYDQLKWHEIVGVAEEEVTALKSRDELADWLGIETSELETEKGIALRAEIDMLQMIDKDDPPVLLINPRPNELPGDIVHHPRHSIAIKKKCDEVGAPCSIVLKDTPSGERMRQDDFIMEHLKEASPAAAGE